jgi:hypothetical protein
VPAERPRAAPADGNQLAGGHVSDAAPLGARTNPPGHRPPYLVVPVAWADQGVGDLVQQRGAELGPAVHLHEVPGDRRQLFFLFSDN